MLRLIPILMLVLLPLAAQEARLAGPISGFVFDIDSIRPILGLPGAAYLGDPLVSGLQWASVAPDGKAALALRDGAMVAIRGLDALNPVLSPVEAGIAQPERAAWSTDGAAAAVYSAGLVQVIRATGEAGPANPVEGEVSALALDGAGRVLIGAADGVYLLAPDEPALALARVERPAAILLAGTAAYIAGRDGIFEIRDYAAGPKPVLMAEMAGPVGLALARDGALYAAGASGIDVLSLASRTVIARLAADAELSALEPLSGGIFLLNLRRAAGEPLLVLDLTREPGVFFVPAGRGE